MERRIGSPQKRPVGHRRLVARWFTVATAVGMNRRSFRIRAEVAVAAAALCRGRPDRLPRRRFMGRREAPYPLCGGGSWHKRHRGQQVCAPHKISLARRCRDVKLCHATRSCRIADVSSLNLAAPLGAAFFHCDGPVPGVEAAHPPLRPDRGGIFDHVSVYSGRITTPTDRGVRVFQSSHFTSRPHRGTPDRGLGLRLSGAFTVPLSVTARVAECRHRVNAPGERRRTSFLTFSSFGLKQDASRLGTSEVKARCVRATASWRRAAVGLTMSGASRTDRNAVVGTCANALVQAEQCPDIQDVTRR